MTHEYDPIDLALGESSSAKVEISPERRTQIEDLNWMMADPRGRRFVWRIFGMSRVFGQSFAVDPHITAFNEGSRAVGSTLLVEVNTHCLDRYFEMVKENS